MNSDMRYDQSKWKMIWIMMNFWKKMRYVSDTQAQHTQKIKQSRRKTLGRIEKKIILSFDDARVDPGV